MNRISKFKTSNGIQVFFLKNTFCPKVIFNVAYKVGARDEDEQYTGMAHLFEHLMFSGSKNIPVFDTAIQKIGGSFNAFTTSDFTNYYTIVPEENIETSLWLESDRMMELACNQDALSVQKKVVIEEFRQRYLNQPYGTKWHELRALCYKTSPYRWPTIGKNIEDIEKVTLDVVQDFFKRFYAPKQATITIAGSFQEQKMKDLLAHWFNGISPRSDYQRDLPQEEWQKGVRRKTVKENVPQDCIMLAWLIPPLQEPDFVALDFISDIFSHGESSRLYSELVKNQKICSHIAAYHTFSMERGLFVIEAMLCPGVAPEKVEASILEEIHKISHQDIPQEELEKCKNQREAEREMLMMNLLDYVMYLNFYHQSGNMDNFHHHLQLYLSLNQQEIKKACDTYLDSNKMNALYYLKK